MKEGHIVADIFKHFYKHKEVFLWRSNAGCFKTKHGSWVQCNFAGCADLIGFKAPTGQFLAVEVKLPGNDQQDNQKAFQSEVEARGGLYVLAYSLDDAVNGIMGAMA